MLAKKRRWVHCAIFTRVSESVRRDTSQKVGGLAYRLTSFYDAPYVAGLLPVMTSSDSCSGSCRGDRFQCEGSRTGQKQLDIQGETILSEGNLGDLLFLKGHSSPSSRVHPLLFAQLVRGVRPSRRSSARGNLVICEHVRWANRAGRYNDGLMNLISTRSGPGGQFRLSNARKGLSCAASRDCLLGWDPDYRRHHDHLSMAMIFSPEGDVGGRIISGPSDQRLAPFPERD